MDGFIVKAIENLFRCQVVNAKDRNEPSRVAKTTIGIVHPCLT